MRKIVQLSSDITNDNDDKYFPLNIHFVLFIVDQSFFAIFPQNILFFFFVDMNHQHPHKCISSNRGPFIAAESTFDDLYKIKSLLPASENSARQDS